MAYCCVPFCTSNGNKPDSSKRISFHEFPVDDVIRTAWIKAISRLDKNSGNLWTPSDRSVVCSEHFKPECYKQNVKRKILIRGSIPSIFPGYPAYMSPSSNPRKRRKNSKNFMHEAGSSKDAVLKTSCSEDACGITSTTAEENSVNNDMQQTLPADSTMLFNEHSLLRKKYATAERKIRRLKAQIKQLKEQNKSLSEETKCHERILHEHNIMAVKKGLEEKDPKALFLKEQLLSYGKKRMTWTDSTIRYTILLRHKSPSAYRYIRKLNILTLPSPSTLKRYIGNCNPSSMLTLIQQRLRHEYSQLTEKEAFGSLIIDEMKIKPLAKYANFSDSVIGHIKMNGLEVEAGIEDKLATQLLAFMFCGLSSHYKIPVGYFFTSAVKGAQLYKLALHVMKIVEDSGFIVLRIATDNAKSNVALFNQFCSGDIQPELSHPLDTNRSLFLSYDYCHILKNIINQLVSKKRALSNNGKQITIYPLEDIQKMQADWVIKPIRYLTVKHIRPNNMQKMNVKLAVQLFSPEVLAVLKFLHEHGSMYDIKGFKDCEATITFFENVNKWFTIHNIKNTTSHINTRNTLMQQFFNVDDDRLSWLENDFLNYLSDWKKSTTNSLQFLTEETYAAIILTTKSTVKCIRYLLNEGFHYVLTRRFSSDDVESLFSAIRQLNGSNDQTNAANCILSLHKILITGLIKPSEYASVQSTSENSDASKMALNKKNWKQQHSI